MSGDTTRYALGAMSCACALGRTRAEVLANYHLRRAPGMREISGDVPGRSLWFGGVPGELSSVAPGGLDMRANRLLELALAQSGGAFERAVAEHGPARVAVVLGVSNTGVDEAQGFVESWLSDGVRPARFDFSMLELGAPTEYLARRLGIRGPSYSVSTACSSAAKAFAAAARLLEAGVADAVVTGGVDGRCRFAMNGFGALGALSAGRCRPLAPDRDGINLGEGVALFLMTRGADAKVLYAGAGETSDAYHPTAPDPEGGGAERAMRGALAAAGLQAAEVDYLNLHGTGTAANDAMEMKAVRRVFGEASDGMRIESTKDLTGHCLGAAGAVEAALCWLMVESGAARRALSNSFAFGGSNATTAFVAG